MQSPDLLAEWVIKSNNLPPAHQKYGRVRSVVGLLIEANGLDAAVGELCYVMESPAAGRPKIKAEVVGIRNNLTILMPLDEVVGIRAGYFVERASMALKIKVGYGMLGRVLGADGMPIDGKGPFLSDDDQLVNNTPPAPLDRPLISTPMFTKIRAIDGFLTIGRGQRIGIFAGSGVGKSTLMGMIARQSDADVNVIALIGERGREVQEFIHDNLGTEGLKKSVVVAVTGDQAAMSRVKGASVATAIAEYFRDQGKHVMLMMDSVTRVAMAQREIGLASGEPPTTRGYTPSVFALLPRLLERAGTNKKGSITGIYTVLVDGDDMNEPVGDAARGILDGHIVLSRKLAHANHFPAIDILHSVSRVMPRVIEEKNVALAGKARTLLADYADAEDLIRIGAYKAGSSPRTDNAVAAHDLLEKFLIQSVSEVAQPNIWGRLGKIVVDRA